MIAEVDHRFDVVICEHKELDAVGKQVSLTHDVGHLLDGTAEGGNLTLRNREIEITPFDAQIVARAVQNLLVGLAHLCAGDIACHALLDLDRIVALFVHNEFLGGKDGDGNVMGFAVDGLIIDRHIGNGTGHRVQVVGQKRGGETDGEKNLAVGELIGGGEGIDVNGDLLDLFAV